MVAYYTRHRLLLPKLPSVTGHCLPWKLIGFEVFAPALKAPTLLMREAEASKVSAFRTVPKAFGRKEKVRRYSTIFFLEIISNFLIDRTVFTNSITPSPKFLVFSSKIDFLIFEICCLEFYLIFAI